VFHRPGVRLLYPVAGIPLAFSGCPRALEIDRAEPFQALLFLGGQVAAEFVSAGEVRNGSSRMKEGVHLRGIAQEILVSSSSPQSEKRLRRLRSDPPPYPLVGFTIAVGRRGRRCPFVERANYLR
jgi:hypothetical protein